MVCVSRSPGHPTLGFQRCSRRLKPELEPQAITRAAATMLSNCKATEALETLLPGERVADATQASSVVGR
jgi:hypothetical protein